MSAVWIPVLASMKGFIAEVNRGAESAGRSAGGQLEKSLGDAGSRGGAAAASEMARAVEAQTGKITSARAAQAKAAADVEAAEHKLKSLRDSGNASASQIARAEQQLETAKGKHQMATDQLARGERDLESVRNGGQATAAGLARAEDQLASAKVQATTALGRARTAELQVDEARAKSSAAADKVTAAEQKVIDTRDRYGAGAKQVAAAERQLETAKRQASAADDQVVAASGRAKRARADLASANDNVKSKSLLYKAAQEDAARAEKRAGDEAQNATGKVRGLGAAMSGAEPGARSMTSGLMGLAGKATLAAGAFMGVQGASGILSSGFDRLMNIQRAEINFQAIGLTAEQTESQMAKLSDQVTGTSVSLADAAKYSAMFAQAGVELGAPMDDAIQAFTNLSAAAVGTGIDVGRIMQQVAASGKIDAGVLNQLSDAGVNAAQLLSDYTGKSVEEVRKLASEGQISFEDLTGAINEGMGDYAQAMGETLPAKMANAKTAFANFGAGLIEPFIGPLTTAVEWLTDGLKTLTPKIKEWGSTLQDVGGWLADNSDLVGTLAAAIGGAAAAWGLWTGAIKLWQTATKVATAIQAAFNAVMAANPIMLVVMAIAAVVAALVYFFTQTETGKRLWESFTNFLGESWGKITAWASDTWETISSIWSGIPTWFGEKWGAVTSKVSEVWESIKTTISEKWTAITEWFTGAWEAYKAQVSANWEAIKAIFTGVWESIWGVITDVWTRISTWITNAWNLFQAYVHLVWTAVKMIFTGQWGAIQQLIIDVWTRISTWITAKWEEFKAYVHLVWRGIQNVFAEVWDAIKTKIWETWESIKASVAEAVANVISKMQEFVNGIREKIDEAVGKLRDFPGQVKQLFADAGRWLVNAGRNIINGLWEGMKNAWSNVKSWLSDNLSFSAIGSLVGLRSGGIVVNADGGIMRAYVAGGIDQVEQYANGGRRGERHVAQIAPAGAWRVWAEPETGGEAYIPLSPRKRARSTAILDEVAARFGYTLVDAAGRPYSGGYSGDLGPQHVTNFADGGVVTGDDLLSFVGGSDVGYGAPSRPLHGAPYDWGGVNWGDCSGAVSAVANTAVGMRSFGSRFATANEASELTRMGFSRGRGGDGDLRIGFKNGGPAGGHTSGTLPDGTNFEMGGAANQGSVGARAAGAWDSYYNEFFYLPISPGFEKVELDEWGDLSPNPEVPTGTPNNVTVTESAPVAGTETTATGSQETTISGMLGDVAKDVVSGQVSDFLSVFGIPDTVPAWMTAGRDIRDAQKSGTGARTSTAEESAIEQHDAAVTTMTPSEIAQDPQLRGIDNPDVINQPEVPEWGPEFFAYEIARQAKAMGLSADGAKIGIATALVESGDPMLMYANNRVPESLKYRHDALGSDHDSVGLFQQRDNGAWGTVKERMTPFDSAGMFFRELVKFDWESMDPGAAAQKVQRSAFPDRYATKMDRAMQMVEGTGLYDQGGILDDKHLALNLSGKPEAVLTNDQWKMIDQLGGNLPDLVGGAVSSGVSGAVSSGAGAVGGVANTIVPGSGAMIASAAGPIGELGGWYAGEVASGWTQAILDASQQALDIAAAPLEDLGGVLSGPLAPVIDSPRPNVRAADMPTQNSGATDDRVAPGTVVIQVNSVDEALEAKRHLEARQLAGFGVTR